MTYQALHFVGRRAADVPGTQAARESVHHESPHKNNVHSDWRRGQPAPSSLQCPGRPQYSGAARKLAMSQGIDWGAVARQRMERAKDDILIMAPGPINRGVEITPDVADGPQSVILDQVTNGLAVRMAVLWLVDGARRREQS